MATVVRTGLLALLSLGFALASVADDKLPSEPPWKQSLAAKLPVLGHRNWIVIADAAYPAQCKPGIQTIVTRAEHLDVIEYVLAVLAEQKHLRPNVYLDAELPYVEERDARGISRLRNRMKVLIGRRPTTALPHNEIINKLDRAAEKFQVLVLKTNLTLPYTSVFLELDCGYWSQEAEDRLREAMKKPLEDPRQPR